LGFLKASRYDSARCAAKSLEVTTREIVGAVHVSNKCPKRFSNVQPSTNVLREVRPPENFPEFQRPGCRWLKEADPLDEPARRAAGVGVAAALPLEIREIFGRALIFCFFCIKAKERISG